MDKFKSLASIGVPIEIANCDTDQIIPARFLRRSKSDPEYPTFLFHDLRFKSDGSRTDFIYNKFGGSAISIFVNQQVVK